MEKQLAKIVNKGLVGEPENVVLQVIDTLKIFEFSPQYRTWERQPQEQTHLLPHPSSVATASCP